MTDAPLTMSIPEAGRRYYGLGRDRSYQAAKAGLIPFIEEGRRKIVPVRAMEAKLERDIAEALAAAAERRAATAAA